MSVLTIPIVPPNINKVSELAEDPRPVASFSDTFFLIANQSTDPAVKKISETYIVHYDMTEAIRNASQSLGVMCEATTFLQYTIRLANRQGCRIFNLFRSRFTNKYGLSNMTIMNEPLTSFGVSFALPKNSPYTDKYEKLEQRNCPTK